MAIKMEGGTDYTKDPVEQSHNPDGTVNKKYIQSAATRRRVNWLENETDSARNAIRAKGLEKGAIRKQDERRKDRTRQADLDAVGRRKSHRGKNPNAAAVHFAPYTDHIRVAKDKAAKRLKIMKKRSYYEDV